MSLNNPDTFHNKKTSLNHEARMSIESKSKSDPKATATHTTHVDLVILANQLFDELRAQHESLYELVISGIDYDKNGDFEANEDILVQLKQQFAQHNQIEEQTLYNRLSGDVNLYDMIEEARDEHNAIEYLIEELSDQNLEKSSSTGQFWNLLQTELTQHFKTEEFDIFPEAINHFQRLESFNLNYGTDSEDSNNIDSSQRIKDKSHIN